MSSKVEVTINPKHTKRWPETKDILTYPITLLVKGSGTN